MLNRPVHRPLPDISDISPMYYQNLPVPANGDDCQHMMQQLKAQVTDIGLQIASTDRSGRNFYDWRRSAYRAVRAKKNQLRILREWYRIYVEEPRLENKRQTTIKLELSPAELEAVTEALHEAIVSGEATDNTDPIVTSYLKLQQAGMD